MKLYSVITSYSIHYTKLYEKQNGVFMAKKSSATRIVLKFTGTLLQLFLNIILYTAIVLLVVKGGQEAFV